jgi:hypothetical protein
MLAARQAVDLLHHLSDFVWEEPTQWPRQFTGLEDVRSTIETRCLFLREPTAPTKDVTNAGSMLQFAGGCPLPRNAERVRQPLHR